MKDITNILAAYEKYILAGIEFQKLCGEDDFKNYAYTIRDYENKKPVSKLFLAAINTPKLFRKETENFIKEVIKASGLEQTDQELREKFKKFIYSWKRLLIEINKIPEESRLELIKNLKNITKPDFALAEGINLKEWVYKNNDSGVVYIWDMYIDPRDKGTWCSAEEYNGEYDGSVFKTKEAAYNEAKIHLYELEDEGNLRGDPEDYDIDVIAIPKNKVSQRSLKISGLTESQTLKTLSSDNIKVEENGGHFEIYKAGKLVSTCDNMKEVKDELNELETNKNKYKVTWAVIEKDDSVNYKSEEVEAADEEEAFNLIKDKNAFDKKAIKLGAVERSLAEEFKIYENLWD